MKRFLTLIFGDVGLVITSVILTVLSAFLFPPFMAYIRSKETMSTFLAILLGVITVCFYASSSVSAIIVSFRSGINKKWVVFVLSLAVLIANVVILIINLV